jgi:hypothetical protein
MRYGGGERYAAKLRTTSPKFTLDDEGIVLYAQSREKEGRLDRKVTARRIPATCKLRRGKSERAAMPESRGGF